MFVMTVSCSSTAQKAWRAIVPVAAVLGETGHSWTRIIRWPFEVSDLDHRSGCWIDPSRAPLAELGEHLVIRRLTGKLRGVCCSSRFRASCRHQRDGAGPCSCSLFCTHSFS
jgi:hypothetical protein